MIDVQQFRRSIVRPVLILMGPRYHSPAAENLLVGTAVQESGLRYLRQLNDGPALGLYQMEPATHDDMWINYINYREDLKKLVVRFMAPEPELIDQLTCNLAYATVIARLKYWRDMAPLPDADNIEALGKMWKRVWNTEAGAGTVPQFIDNYLRHVQ